MACDCKTESIPYLYNGRSYLAPGGIKYRCAKHAKAERERDEQAQAFHARQFKRLPLALPAPVRV